MGNGRRTDLALMYVLHISKGEVNVRMARGWSISVLGEQNAEVKIFRLRKTDFGPEDKKSSRKKRR